MHLAGPPRGLDQEGACTLGLARGQPVVGREIGWRATRLEEAAKLAVERASLRPVRVRVERLAHQVMPKRGAAGLDLVEQTAVENLAQAGIALQGREQVELDVDADDRGRLERRSSVVRKIVGADAERVAERLRDRDARAVLELEAIRAGLESRPCSQRGRQLFDEKRHPLSAVIQGSAERRAGLPVEDLRSETGARSRVEWLHDELDEAARATQVCAEPAQRVAARDLLAAVRAEHEEWPLLDGLREGRQQLQGCCVRPVEVVDEDNRRLLRCDRFEGRSHGLDQGLAVGDARRRPELRQEGAEMRDERI